LEQDAGKEGAKVNECIVEAGEASIYESDFELAIQEACQHEEIDDLRAAGQSPWKAVCKDIGLIMFSDKSILKSKILVIDEGNNIKTNHNSYDYDIINNILEYYCKLSNKYNKLISLEAFSLFMNMPRDTIRLWGKNEPNTSSFRVFEKVMSTRLESILDRAADNGNVTGTMFVGNTEFGLNLPGVTREQSTREISTASLPKLSANSAQLPISDQSPD
jgi:hypothetical protein